jgi:NADH-quinone oxidoreductase subunit L
MSNNLLFILLPPLLGFFLCGFLAYRWKNLIPHNAAQLSGTIATLSILISFIFVVVNFIALSGTVSITGDVAFIQTFFTWLEVDGLVLDMSFRFDHLSAVMCLVITGIGALIHLYSMGYMAHDKGVARYFSYLNLFVFFMLILVLGESLPVMFIGWEGVGLCSYLLIGFWYKESENIAAAQKAFIVNRVGDFAFLVGMFLIYNQFGTLKFSEINNVAGSLAIGMSSVLMVASLLLFIGATGKSAQFPLYVWLPDAMAGPTPVSALIHAATMVTAGIYMLVRLHPLFLLNPVVMQVIASVGLLTAFLAATMALVQNDIKKVLAYSTISQLGFMFLACGVGAYNTAMFHLITHAFFKALLFLGAGSVIHACNGQQDMLQMGGLKKQLPHTHKIMLIGSIALAGLPPFAGFFSKDEILYSALSLPMGSISLYVIAQFIAVLTAIYTARMLVLTFYGETRMEAQDQQNVHESPWIMLLPLYILSLCSMVAGLLGLPHYLNAMGIHVPHILNSWFSSSILQVSLPEQTIGGLTEASVSVISIILGLVSFIFSSFLFVRILSISEIPSLKLFSKVWANLYDVDAFYKNILVDPANTFAQVIYRKIDRQWIDGFSKFCVWLSLISSRSLKNVQNGHTQSYAILFILGLLVSLLLLNMSNY